jgi:hypothetical protein
MGPVAAVDCRLGTALLLLLLLVPAAYSSTTHRWERPKELFLDLAP